MHAEADHKLVFGTHLDVVACLQLTIPHVVFFHAHEGGIMIRFGIAVASRQNRSLLLILLHPRQVFLG